MPLTDILAITGLIATIAAIPIGIFIGRRSRQRPDLRYSIDTERVLSPADWLLAGGLSVTFADERIRRVCRTNVAIWNHRGDTIRRADTVSTDPLRLVLSDWDTILQVRVMSRSREQIGVEVSPSPERSNEVFLSFDFLDAKDGAILEVLHHEPEMPELTGTLVGAKLHRKKRMRLDARARAIARMPWYKRFGMGADRPSLTAIVLFLPLFLLQIAVLTQEIARLVSPKLVELGGRDLTTLEGQQAFASEVNKVGLAIDLLVPITFISTVILTFIFLVFAVRGLVRSPLPPSIARDDLDPVEVERSSWRELFGRLPRNVVRSSRD